MHFDFEGRYIDTPSLESAMSWRERLLLSFFVHLLLVALVLVVPRLQFMQDAAQRRADRLASIIEDERLALLQERREEPRFIFVEPFVDTSASAPPPSEAALSDLDRVAQSPEQDEMPLNDLPNAQGNSFEFVESESPSGGRAPFTATGERLDATEEESESSERIDVATREANPEPEDPDVAPGDGGLFENPSLDARGNRPPDAVSPTQSDQPGRILNQALGRLNSVSRSQSFHNLRGRTDRYGPDIQFDSKGVDFGVWIRRFRAQIYRNWFIPYAAMSMSGSVVLTFNVHKDGAVTDLMVQRPSTVDAFTNSAHNAMRGSNPTYPLPPEYPEDQAFFTVTFYFNERPPGR